MSQELDKLEIGRFFTSDWLKVTGTLNTPSLNTINSLLLRLDKNATDQDVESLKIDDEPADESVVYEVVQNPSALLATAVNPLGGIDVNIQDQTTPSVEHFLYQELADVVIQGTPARGDNVLTLAPGHGFFDPVAPNKDYLNIHYVDTDIGSFVGIRFSQHAVISVTGDDITITPKLPYGIDPSKIEKSKRVNVNMAVNASLVAPVRFTTTPPDGLRWDLNRLIGDMILTSGADDGKFGNLPAIPNGQYFGFENAFFAEYNLAVFDNGGWRASSYDVDYTTRSGGGGDFGMAVRKTSNGQDKSGVAIRLEGDTDDEFVSYIQDDISLITRYRIKIMGHIVD